MFSDYMRATFRLASIMELPVTYVFTHDSIAVGEEAHPQTGRAGDVTPPDAVHAPHSSGRCKRDRSGLEAGSREQEASDSPGVNAAGGSHL